MFPRFCSVRVGAGLPTEQGLYFASKLSLLRDTFDVSKRPRHGAQTRIAWRYALHRSLVALSVPWRCERPITDNRLAYRDHNGNSLSIIPFKQSASIS